MTTAGIDIAKASLVAAFDGATERFETPKRRFGLGQAHALAGRAGRDAGGP